MKKEVFKGAPTKVMGELEDYFSKLTDAELNKIYQVTVDNTRSLEINNLFHSMVREIANETGEEDINRMKNLIKTELGYFKITEVETDDACYITKIYEKTSEMNNKTLSEFILKFEIWALNTLNYTFESTKDNKKSLFKTTYQKVKI